MVAVSHILLVTIHVKKGARVTLTSTMHSRGVQIPAAGSSVRINFICRT